jgi:hypothetical protein
MTFNHRCYLLIMYDVRSHTALVILVGTLIQSLLYITVSVGMIRHAITISSGGTIHYSVRYYLRDRCFTFWSAVR